MHILITGGSSYLGRHLVPLAAQRHAVCATSFSRPPDDLPGGVRLDLRDAAAVMQLGDDWRPDVIIHLAGSNRTPDMEAVIVQGAAHVARLAERVQARLIHLSTDVLFDGTAAPYDETAEPTPIHAYGRAKAMAERLIATWPNHVIVRTSLIYGLRSPDAGVEWMQRALAAGETITLFTDHWRNPVYADHLAQACLELAELDDTGVLNVAGEQALTRADFAGKLLTYWGVPLTGRVRCAPDESGRFPRDCRLALERARRLLRTPLWGVDEVLARCA